MINKLIRRKYRVHSIPAKKLQDFAAMNHFAAKDMHFPVKPKKDEIVFAAGSNKYQREKNVKHEFIEAELMRKNHMGYGTAHMIAMRYESKPEKSILSMLYRKGIKI